MHFRTLALAASSLAVTAAAAFLAGRAAATGVPGQTPLTYGGTVTDAQGKPYPTAQDVTVSFFAAPTGGTAKCAVPKAQAEAGTGRFQVTLPPECVQAVHDVPDLWAEAKVAGTTLPRVKVGAVPYALQAAVASAAGGPLKQALDQTAADVAGLKAGGSAGPWVADASGKKLGRLVGLTPNSYLVGTASGHIVRVDFSGGYESGYVNYTEENCGGTMYLQPDQTPGVTMFNPSANSFFVPVPGVKKVPFARKSYRAPVAGSPCANNYWTHEGYQAKEVTAAQVGVPTVLVGPATLVP